MLMLVTPRSLFQIVLAPSIYLFTFCILSGSSGMTLTFHHSHKMTEHEKYFIQKSISLFSMTFYSPMRPKLNKTNCSNR